MHDRKWQYKVETVKISAFSKTENQDAQIQERLNRLGMEGWELVNMVVGYGSYPRLIMRK